MAVPATVEGFTRHLRAKETPVAEIVELVDLLLVAPPVDIPNGTAFVLDLLCTRLNTSAEWRKHTGVWRAFLLFWSVADPAVQASCLRTIRIVDVVAKAIAEDVEVMALSLALLHAAYTAMFMEISEKEALLLLGSYCKGLLHTSESPALTAIVVEVYAFVFRQEHFGKKTVAAFVASAAQPLLEASAQGCSPALTSLLLMLFQPGLPHIVEHTKALLGCSAGALAVLFSQAVANLGSAPISTCEEMFTVVAKAHPEMSKRLLGALSTVLRSLLTEFLTSVSDLQDFELVAAVWKLDSDVAVSQGEAVLRLDLPLDAALPLISTLVSAYSKARELEGFLAMWSSALGVWTLQASVDAVARHTTDLTAAQLTRVVSATTALHPLVAIAQGLVDSRGLCDFLVWPIELGSLTTSPLAWRLHYLLLSLYPDQADVSAVAQLSSELYSVYTCMRIREWCEFDVSLVAKQYLDVLELAPELLSLSLSRWVVLIGHTFPAELQKRYVALCLQHSREELLASACVWELSLLTTPLVDLVVSGTHAGIVERIPIQCLLKKQRQVLSAQACEANDAPALVHLLQQPTFTSSAEASIKGLVAFAKQTGSDAAVAAVWAAHRQQGNGSHVEFLLGGMKWLRKKAASSPAALKAAVVVVNDKGLDTDEYREARQALRTRLGEVLVEKVASDPVYLLNALAAISCPCPPGALAGVVGVSLDPALLASAFRAASSGMSLSHALAVYVVLRERVAEEDLGEAVAQTMLADPIGALAVILTSLDKPETVASPAALLAHVSLILAALPLLPKDSQAEVVAAMSSFLDVVDAVAAEAMPLFLAALGQLLVESSSLFGQYGIELCVVVAVKASVRCFVPSTRLFSTILRVHRFRFSQRTPLLMIAVLNMLANVANGADASAWSRLASTLSEPSGGTADLSTTAGSVKRVLRRHAHVVVLWFVRFSLSKGWGVETRRELKPGMYSVLALLSAQERLLVSALSDASGKAEFDRLWGEYQREGKWVDK